MKLAEKIKSWQMKGYKFVIACLQDNSQNNPSEAEVRSLCEKFLVQEKIFLPQIQKLKIIDNITYSIVGLGPLEFLLRDDSVSEIMVNGYENIFVEKNGKLEKTNFVFLSPEQLIQVINQIVGPVGRRIDESTPLVDARLSDGSRVNAIIPPLSLNGATLTIRKFPKKSFKIQDMLAYGSLSLEMAEFLKFAVRSKQNILVSGGTGAGKTSTLNACASLIPYEERLVTIEDAAEIRIEHPHLISLESRAPNIEGRGEIPIRILLKNALRMRPDRIVVGEIRGGEAIDMLQAMNTGHKGSLTTVHSNSPLESLFRVETMVLMGDVDLPLSAIRPQIIQGIDLIVQQERLHTGERKVTKISEVKKDFRASDYEVNDIFWYDLKTQMFEKNKNIPDCVSSSSHYLADSIKKIFS